MTADAGHVPVLLEETLRLLEPRPGETAVDCTAGRGGHAIALARAVGPGGRVIGFDVDPKNLEFAAERVKAETGTPFIAICENFIRMPEHLARLGTRADAILADLGFSSTQMDDPARGLSFTADGPLDMRFDPDGPTTAADLLATLTEPELAEIIHRYGEEPLARRIARKLAQEQRIEPIRTTARLARLVVEAYGARARTSRMHPATRTFMAMRIAVNDELSALRSLLEQIGREAGRAGERDSWLAAGARVGIIAFHSLEDRIVKQAFADLERRSLAVRLTKRPARASEQEAQANPRARSAKLRVARIRGPHEHGGRL